MASSRAIGTELVFYVGHPMFQLDRSRARHA